METRQSRMDKYFDLEENGNNQEETVSKGSSRLQRNQELYKTVSSMDIEGFDLNSNSLVLDSNVSDIDLDDVKERLEEQYHENPRNKSFGDTDEINLPKINLDETREYDINAILAKAKEEKEINYEEDRHRKVNDVLKDIEEFTKSNSEALEKEDSKSGVAKEKEEELKELIDTINAKELISEEENLEVTGEMDPLDLLSDLKGDDDNTRVLGQLTEEMELVEEPEEKSVELTTEEIKEISELSDEEPTEEVELLKEEEIEEKPAKKSKMKAKEDTVELDNSFIGKTSTFNEEDFDDFEDLKEDMKVTKVIIKILVIIIVLVFIAGLVILANSKFNWGLF